MSKRVDLVFEGGGAKGVALSGALAALVERGFSPGRLVGTSAGAITATNVSIGYSALEMRDGSLEKLPNGKSVYTSFSDGAPTLSDTELLSTELGQALGRLPMPFVHDKAALLVLRTLDKVPGLRSVLALAEQGGLHKGDAFLAWMQRMFKDKGLDPGMTFAQHHALTGVDLSHVVTDTTAQCMCVFNHRTTPLLPVVWGVRMSMSIPMFWREVIWRSEWGSYMGQDISGHAMVDGGVVSNFALRLFSEPGNEEVVAWMGSGHVPARVLGLYLDASLPMAEYLVPEHRGLHSPLMARIDTLIDTMMNASDNSAIHTHPELVCRLPVKGVGSTQFDLPDAGYKALYDSAHAAMLTYLDEGEK